VCQLPKSNEERLGAIIFCLDPVCRVVYLEIEQAACKNSRILRTEEFEELLLAWMCIWSTVVSALVEQSTLKIPTKRMLVSRIKQTTMKKNRRIQYVDSNLTGMGLRNEGRDLHYSRDKVRGRSPARKK
jgi:hypothetical protein